MSVHFMKSRSLWFAKWLEEGKERRKYFKTETEARLFEQERLQAEAEQEERLTFGDLAIRYFKARPEFHHDTKKAIVRMIAGYEKDGRHITGPAEFLRDKYAESLNRQDLEALREAYRERGAGNNTINKRQAYVRAILSWGVDNDLIHFNPWRDYKLLKYKRPIIQVSLENLRRVYVELPPHLQWAVKTAFFLALRPGHVELFSLLWTTFDWRRGIVVVRQGKSGMLKTVVPHPAYMQEARRRFEEDMARGIELVCHRKNGQKIRGYRTTWHNACLRAGVQMRPYDIRHIAATEMLARGADLAAVSAQLGHSNVTTTGTTYAHVTAGSQALAGSLMPAISMGDTGSDTSSDTDL